MLRRARVCVCVCVCVQQEGRCRSGARPKAPFCVRRFSTPPSFFKSLSLSPSPSLSVCVGLIVFVSLVSITSSIDMYNNDVVISEVQRRSNEAF